MEKEKQSGVFGRQVSSSQKPSGNLFADSDDDDSDDVLKPPPINKQPGEDWSCWCQSAVAS